MVATNVSAPSTTCESPFASERGGATLRAPFAARARDTSARRTEAQDTTDPETRVNAVAPLRIESPAEMRRETTLRECIARAVQRHLEQGARAADLYRLVLAEVERPLLSEVLAHVDGNQSRAAQILGLSRTTLRKKLREHGLD